MESHLVLQIANTLAPIAPLSRLSHFFYWHIPSAFLQLFALSKGQLLQQSVSTYLSHVDLFQCMLNEQPLLNFVKKEATILLLMVAKGNYSLYNSSMECIARLKEGSYQLIYMYKGNYSIQLHSEINELLVFTLRAEWFMKEAGNYKTFKTLIDHYRAGSPGVYPLPFCPLHKNTARTLQRTFSKPETDVDTFYSDINTFIAKLIAQYHQKLAHHTYATLAVHELKAAEISAFVRTHFKETIVDDVNALARHFGISKTSLRRLAIVAFGMPLHKQIIALRMDYGRQQLLITRKSIQEIAFDMGYNDARYFSRAFKKYYKVSPGQIRHSNK